MIIGNLVAAPTLRHPNADTSVASAIVANNEFFTNDKGERQQVTTFVGVTVWSKSSENFVKRVRKGQEILIEGELQRDVWKDDEGQLLLLPGKGC